MPGDRRSGLYFLVVLTIFADCTACWLLCILAYHRTFAFLNYGKLVDIKSYPTKLNNIKEVMYLGYCKIGL